MPRRRPVPATRASRITGIAESASFASPAQHWHACTAASPSCRGIAARRECDESVLRRIPICGPSEEAQCPVTDFRASAVHRARRLTARGIHDGIESDDCRAACSGASSTVLQGSGCDPNSRPADRCARIARRIRRRRGARRTRHGSAGFQRSASAVREWSKHAGCSQSGRDCIAALAAVPLRSGAGSNSCRLATPSPELCDLLDWLARHAGLFDLAPDKSRRPFDETPLQHIRFLRLRYSAAEPPVAPTRDSNGVQSPSNQ